MFLHDAFNGCNVSTCYKKENRRAYKEKRPNTYVYTQVLPEQNQLSLFFCVIKTDE